MSPQDRIPTLRADIPSCSPSEMTLWAAFPSQLWNIEPFLLILSHLHKSLIYPNKDRIKDVPKQGPGHRLELCPAEEEGGGSLILQTVGARALLLFLSRHVAVSVPKQHRSSERTGENEFSSFHIGRFVLTQGLFTWPLFQSFDFVYSHQPT